MIPLEWSEPLDLSGPGPLFSPSGEHIAYVLKKDKIIVRDVHTLSIVAYFPCQSPPNQLQWSPNGRNLLSTMPGRRLVTVYCVVKDENDGGDNSEDLDSSSSWVCNLSERLAGVSHSTWSGNGRHVVVVSDFQVKTSAWSLVDSSCTNLCPAKCGGGVKGSPDGSLLAVLTRKNCEDSVCVHDAKAWQLVHQIELPSTDAAGVEWSPDSRHIAIWDTITVGNSLMVVDSLTGKIVGSKKWECENGLGIKCVSWAPSGQFVAVGTHDARMVLLNSVSWTEIACLKHESCIESRDGKQPVFVYAESVGGEVCKIEQAVERQASLRRLGSRNIPKIWSSKTIQDDDGKVSTDEKLVEYEIVPLPLKLNIPRVPRDQVNPKLGVGTIKWSPNGKYLATICDDRPHVVWIWGSGRLSLEAILLHGRPVGCISWRPDESNCLAIVAGTRTVFFWSPEESSCVQMSCDSFKAVGIEWSPEGDVLQVNSKESFCCGFLNTLAPP